MAKTLAELDRAFQLNKGFDADICPVPETETTSPPPEVQSPPIDMAATEIAPDPIGSDTLAKARSKSHGLAALDSQFRVRTDGKSEAAHLDAPLEQTDVDIGSSTETVHSRPTMRVFSFISNVIFYVVMLLLVLTAFMVAQNGKIPFADNYQIYSVMSSSMESVYPKGSFVIVAKIDPDELVIGNDITFNQGTDTITHRIVDIHENYLGSGYRAMTTKGVDNPSADRGYVLAQDIVGKVIFFLPGIGAFLWPLQNNLSLVVIFFIGGVGLSFFLNLALGETLRERKIRKAKAVLKDINK